MSRDKYGTVYLTYKAVTSMAQRVETKDMDVKVAIDRCMLGWLAAVTKESPKVVMCHLYDLSTLCLEGLIKRNGTWSSKKVVFPGTDIKLKVTASRHMDSKTYFKVREEYRDRCITENDGKDYSHKDTQKWVKSNPIPDGRDRQFNFIRCKFTLLDGETEIVMSQHEMDTLMTETFLLGDPDAE